MLEEYGKRRNFSKSPEPGGRTSGVGGIFVIQEHNASHWHHDFRLEKDGVLKSWAVPKGFPEKDERRLAVQTEEHPIEYADFEGTIPKEMYGAGTVKIYDKGKAKVNLWTDDKIEFELEGKKLRGSYVMIKTRMGWLVFRKKNK
ncbi:MAG: 3'-phosphoesterase [Candidatus Micrarchaeota archaeon]|nr:3'-phosphoesterase [Candidatus Micrarchaeota archaeon]